MSHLKAAGYFHYIDNVDCKPINKGFHCTIEARPTGGTWSVMSRFVHEINLDKNVVKFLNNGHIVFDVNGGDCIVIQDEVHKVDTLKCNVFIEKNPRLL